MTQESAGTALLSTRTIRQRCQNIYNAVEHGQSHCFTLHTGRLEQAAAEVCDEIRQNYPSLQVPFHSRWRHFEYAGTDLAAQALNQHASTEQRLSAELELAVISVLLDAGAGDHWRYSSKLANGTYSRSEGLALASLEMFLSGAFSDQQVRCEVLGTALQQMSVEKLATGFQCSSENMLLGLETRVVLLNALGDTIVAQFGQSGRLADLLRPLHASQQIDAAEILSCVLRQLAPIWPQRKTIAGTVVADVWQHRFAGGDESTGNWVPFHKLSQWLSYSLIEPLQRSGVVVTALDDLTGLPEYRNGGLFIDCGVLSLIDEQHLKDRHSVSSELIVEWRALTVILLDQLTGIVREMLKMDADSLPLASVLQGGTWSTGRKLAAKLRDGLPPLAVDSDGTVF